jgi:hypothetical protein
MRTIGETFFLLLFFALLLVWLLSWLALQMAGGAVHILLVIAIVALVMHIFQRHRAV